MQDMNQHYANVMNSVHPGSVARTNAFIRSVWGWMGAGLAISAVTAFVVGTNDALFSMVAPMLMPLSIVTLIGFWFSGSLMNKVKPETAAMGFLVLSALEGLVLSVVFRAYAMPSITSAFITTAGTFGVMSVYGIYTKRDLSEWRTFLMMGLWGVIIGSIVNLFTQSHMMGWIITYAGVLVFTGLIAYSTQDLIRLGRMVDATSAEGKKLAVHGALMLYLNFINLFLFLLRFFGAGGDD